MSKDGGDDFLSKNSFLFKKILEKLTNLGLADIIPGGKGLNFFGVLGGRGASQKEAELKEICEALENFLRDLEKTAGVIEQYTDDQKKKSRLAAEVKTSLTACFEWAQLIEKKTPPADLSKNLKFKASCLSEAVQLETLRFSSENKQQLDFNTFLTGALIKKPLEYYDDGKVLIAQKKWGEAKNSFLHYQKFANASQSGFLPAEYKVKTPTADKHLEYLEYIQKQLNDIILKEADEDALMVLSKVATPKNDYTALKVAWRERFPYKED